MHDMGSLGRTLQIDLKGWVGTCALGWRELNLHLTLTHIPWNLVTPPPLRTCTNWRPWGWMHVECKHA